MPPSRRRHCDSPTISARHFLLRGRSRRQTPTKLPRLGTDNGGSVEVDVPEEGLALQAVTDALIDRTLAMCEGNVSRAARMLGVSRDQLRYRLAKRGA